jgi:hypothetical protein
MGPGPRDPAALVAGYESLRAAAVAGSAQGLRLGLGLVVGRGVAAWMATWSAAFPAHGAGATAADPPAPIRRAPTPQHPSSSTSPLPLPEAGQIVSVIAQMALAHA